MVKVLQLPLCYIFCSQPYSAACPPRLQCKYHLSAMSSCNGNHNLKLHSHECGCVGTWCDVLMIMKTVYRQSKSNQYLGEWINKSVSLIMPTEWYKTAVIEDCVDRTFCFHCENIKIMFISVMLVLQQQQQKFMILIIEIFLFLLFAPLCFFWSPNLIFAGHTGHTDLFCKRPLSGRWYIPTYGIFP